jgi:hypothetical protein
MALDVPVQQVYDAARVPRPLTRWVLPERLDRLDAAQRRLVEDLAGALLDAYEKGAEARPITPGARRCHLAASSTVVYDLAKKTLH